MVRVNPVLSSVNPSGVNRAEEGTDVFVYPSVYLA